MRNVCKYMALVVAVVMALMMVSCGADKGTDVAQNTKSKAANSKNTSSVVSGEAVTAEGSLAETSSDAVSFEASSESVSSVAASSKATSSKATSSGAWSSGKVTHGDSGGDVVTAPTYESSSRTVSSWVCPEPGAHDGVDCYSQLSHDSYVRQTKELAEHEKWLNETVLPSIPEGYTRDTWCIKCNRPLGDGYNGTCYRYLCHQGVNGSSCHHYDEDDGTCKEKHWGYAEEFGHE